MARRSNHDQLTPLRNGWPSRSAAASITTCNSAGDYSRSRSKLNTAVDDPPEFVLTPRRFAVRRPRNGLVGVSRLARTDCRARRLDVLFSSPRQYRRRTGLLEPYERETFCRRLNHFRTHEAGKAVAISGRNRTRRAWLLAVENDNQGTFRIDFLGRQRYARVCDRTCEITRSSRTPSIDKLVILLLHLPSARMVPPPRLRHAAPSRRASARRSPHSLCSGVRRPSRAGPGPATSGRG